MYTAATVTDFNQRAVLGNSYCNCFHLMCRVEKSTWYIFKKQRCSRDTPCWGSWKYLKIANLKFQYQATRNCFLCLINSFMRPVLQLEIPYKFDENICLFQYRRQFFCIFIKFDFLELERNGLKLLQYSILKYVDWLIVFFDEWNWASMNHMGSILIHYGSFWCVAFKQKQKFTFPKSTTIRKLVLF